MFEANRKLIIKSSSIQSNDIKSTLLPATANKIFNDKAIIVKPKNDDILSMKTISPTVSLNTKTSLISIINTNTISSNNKLDNINNIEDDTTKLVKRSNSSDDASSVKSKCSSYSNISDESLTTTTSSSILIKQEKKQSVDFLNSKKFKNNFFKDKNIILHKNKIKQQQQQQQPHQQKSKKQTIKNLLNIKDLTSNNIPIQTPSKSRNNTPTKLKLSSSEHKKNSIKIKRLKEEFRSNHQQQEQNLIANTINNNIKLEPENFNLTTEEINLFESIMYREFDPNGGSTILIANQDDIDKKISVDLIDKFSTYFISQVYSESKIENDSNSIKLNDDLTETLSTKENNLTFNQQPISSGKQHEKAANYVLGIIRNSAEYMPDLLDYLADNHSTMTVKTSLLLNNKEINTLKINEYRKNVNSSYLNGTYRYGPLLQTSIVGIRNEEIGGYFPNLIKIIEMNPFLKKSLPWSQFSINENMDHQQSDDGPIIW
jgi:hypothetical protein